MLYISIYFAYAYALHTHIRTICICFTYTNQSFRHILHPCGKTPWHTQHMRKNHAHSFYF
ncbi:hypothetical protein COO59_20185 [Mixta theicola]|uniref:Uncharacterized protein n=1 Tax=Mixta theicola TaxID=1458355 RepID=A0A2K1Q4F4_9GAMM|nr:hypothetical protein COO59_20185 [Mixta theicola]